MPMKRYLREQLVWQTHTAGDDPRNNGLAEVCIGVGKCRSRAILAASGVPHKYWPYVVRHLDWLYTTIHTNIVTPSVCDQFVFGQKLLCKMRKWHKEKSALLPIAHEVTWLGRNMSLSGDGGLMLTPEGKVRHGNTFVLIPEKRELPPMREVECYALPDNVVQPRQKGPARRLTGKNPNG